MLEEGSAAFFSMNRGVWLSQLAERPSAGGSLRHTVFLGLLPSFSALLPCRDAGRASWRLSTRFLHFSQSLPVWQLEISFLFFIFFIFILHLFYIFFIFLFLFFAFYFLPLSCPLTLYLQALPLCKVSPSIPAYWECWLYNAFIADLQCISLQPLYWGGTLKPMLENFS